MNSSVAQHSFKTTRWSIVTRSAGAVDDADSRDALAAFCETYWHPIYAFIRRSGKSPADAEDLTQGFFMRLKEKEILASADPGKGRLRAYLLECVRNYLSNERDRAMALKRGGAALASFDAQWAEKHYPQELADNLTPDRIFQRRWAMTVLNDSMELLEKEFSEKGKADIFQRLRPFLGFGAVSEQSYDEVAETLGTPVGTLKNQVFRMRERWRELLFERVAMTLEEPTEENIKDELKELLTCV